ncbi:insulinase family protein [Streptomyces sp. G6]|uniref:insulinase family protein n=1 Tax=Streptomyces sp. G6 TaxID=1178736 RepID=UPI003EDA43F3
MIHRFTLPNGLRVVVDPADAGPLVGVAVHYGVGFRSEPPGRAGFAHLFEHLMFDGSEYFPARGYLAEVLAAGGDASGTTHQDYTDYFHTVPGPALERALFAEADRMRAPRFTATGLAEQLSGVEGEIRQALHEAPLGGFPWPLLPALLFDTHPNAHDGYGDTGALARVTVADCEEFFRLHYGPGNAVLTVSGAGDVARVQRLVTRHFADIAHRPAPTPPDLAEPDLTEDRVSVRRFPGLRPGAGAVAAGYRLTDPAGGLEGYLAHMVLAGLLRGQRRSGTAGPIASAECGFFGPLDALTPDTFTVTLRHPNGADPQETLSHLDRALEAAADGLPASRVAGTARRLAAGLHRTGHGPTARARGLGRLELLFGRAELHDELPARVGEVGAARVAAAARGLLTTRRATLVAEPAPTRPRPAPRAPARPAVSGAPPTAKPAMPDDVPAAEPAAPGGVQAARPVVSGVVPVAGSAVSGVVPVAEPAEPGVVMAARPAEAEVVTAARPAEPGVVAAARSAAPGGVQAARPVVSGVVPVAGSAVSGVVPVAEPAEPGVVMAARPAEAEVVTAARPTEPGVVATARSAEAGAVVPAVGSRRSLGLRRHHALGRPGTDRWRVVAVRDDRVPLCEVRVRLTPPPGLGAARLHAHARVLGARWDAQPLLAGGGHTVRVLGGRVHLDGWFTADAAPRWPTLLGELVGVPPGVDELTAAAPAAARALRAAHRSHEGLLDHVLPHLLTGRPVPPLEPALPADVLTAEAGRPAPWTDGLVVLVGDIATAAEGTLKAVLDGSPVADPPAEDGPVPAGPARSGLVHLRAPGPPQLVWTVRERPYPTPRPDPADLAARYLAAVVLGSGHPSARLTRLTTPEAPLGFPVFAGRDTAYGAPRLLVTAWPPATGAARAAHAVHGEITRLADVPPTDREVEAARHFTDGQLHAVFETQAHLADQVAAWELLGLDTGRTGAFTDAVRNLTAAEVARARHAILPDSGLVGVLTGRTGEPEVTP